MLDEFARYTALQRDQMPLAMLLILNLLSPSYIAPLYSCLSGHIIMTGCLGGLCWGIWMMEKISTIEI